MSKKFSIVTVTKNNADGLAKTLASVKCQVCRDFELIIVDGHSTDSTDQVIDEYADTVTCALQDKGNGIYAAMNQGIDAACGDWLIFMNAGDSFYDENVLDKFPLVSQATIVYGGTLIKRAAGFIKATPPVLFWQNMPTAHQSMFFRRNVFAEKKFDVRLNISADFEFFLSVRQRSLKIECLEYDVALVEGGGVSDTKLVKRVWETYRAAIRYYPRFEVHRFYLRKLLWAFNQQCFKNRQSNMVKA